MSEKYLFVGSDPEVQLLTPDNRVISAIDLIPGTKEAPFKTKHGSVQWDNIFAEFNSEPSDNVEDFVNNHKLIIKDLEDIIKPLDLKLGYMASVLADQSLLSDPRASLAGCDPDYSAWELAPNEPADYSITNIRASGGHLHCSFHQADVEGTEGEDARISFVRAMDLVLGVPSVIHDNDTNRRQFYGKAGAFRPKDKSRGDAYNGVEYRTLSNFWLRSESLMKWAFNGVKTVHSSLKEWSELAEEFREDIIHTINTGDRDKAIYLCNRLGVNYAFN